MKTALVLAILLLSAIVAGPAGAVGTSFADGGVVTDFASYPCGSGDTCGVVVIEYPDGSVTAGYIDFNFLT
jgi:hypothetical protein